MLHLAVFWGYLVFCSEVSNEQRLQLIIATSRTFKQVNKATLPHCTIAGTHWRSSCLHLCLTGAGSRQLNGAAVPSYHRVSRRKSSQSVQDESGGGFLRLLLAEALCWIRATFCFTWSSLSLLSTLTDEQAEWSPVHYLFMDFCAFKKLFADFLCSPFSPVASSGSTSRGRPGSFANMSREFLLFIPEEKASNKNVLVFGWPPPHPPTPPRDISETTVAVQCVTLETPVLKATKESLKSLSNC